MNVADDSSGNILQGNSMCDDLYRLTGGLYHSWMMPTLVILCIITFLIVYIISNPRE